MRLQSHKCLTHLEVLRHWEAGCLVRVPRTPSPWIEHSSSLTAHHHSLPPNHIEDSQEILCVTEPVACRGIVVDADLLVRKRKEHLNQHCLLMCSQPARCRVHRSAPESVATAYHPMSMIPVAFQNSLPHQVMENVSRVPKSSDSLRAKSGIQRSRRLEIHCGFRPVE